MQGLTKSTMLPDTLSGLYQLMVQLATVVHCIVGINIENSEIFAKGFASFRHAPLYARKTGACLKFARSAIASGTVKNLADDRGQHVKQVIQKSHSPADHHRSRHCKCAAAEPGVMQ